MAQDLARGVDLSGPMVPVRNKRRRRKSQAGFTLLETMVASAIFLIGMAGVFTLQTAIIKQNALANDLSVATNLAGEALEQLRMTEYDNVAGISQCPTTQSWETLCYFGKQGQAYQAGGLRIPLGAPSAYFTRTWTAVQDPVAVVTDVTVTVTWPYEGSTKSLSLMGRIYPR